MIPVVNRKQPIIFAHRGGGHEVSENTYMAFSEMNVEGIHHIETDARLTSDGVVVLHHDPMVDRTYNGTGLISELTWEQISTLRNDAGERMPVLSEVLDMFPLHWFNIDSKSEDVALPLLDVLEKHNAYDRVLITSFSESRLERIRQKARYRVTTSLGSRMVARLILASQTATNPSSWHIPGPQHGVRAVQVPPSYKNIPIVTPRFIAAAHQMGLAVHVWTINDPMEMLHLAELGVDGIMTDRPLMARMLLRNFHR